MTVAATRKTETISININGPEFNNWYRMGGATVMPIATKIYPVSVAFQRGSGEIEIISIYGKSKDDMTQFDMDEYLMDQVHSDCKEDEVDSILEYELKKQQKFPPQDP